MFRQGNGKAILKTEKNSIDRKQKRVRKRQKSKKAENGRLLRLMTVSLFIILLAFFVLLNSVASVDDEKKTAVIGSVVQSFGGYQSAGEMGTIPVTGSPGEIGAVDFTPLSKHMKSGTDVIDIHAAPGKSVMTIPAFLIFEKGGTAVKPSARPLLSGIAGVIVKNPYPVDIAAYTDTLPPQGSLLTNRELSMLRAVSVMKFLVEKASVNPDSLTACGWGSWKPAFSNETPQTSIMNRRVEIVFNTRQTFDKPSGVFTFRDFFFRVREK